MEQDDKTLWNRKYAEAPEKWLEPDPFLVGAYERFLANMPAGSALDLAGGAGRHAIWLAARGWKVTIVDISDVGLGMARENAAKLLGSELANDRIVTKAADLNREASLGDQRYELVVVFRYLNRALFPALMRTLQPGGTLIYSTYTIAQQKFANGPRDTRFLLQPDELRQAFASLNVLHYDETAQGKGLAELVARKPAAR